MVIQDVHYETGKKAKTWKFDTNIFRYITFLSNAAHAVADEEKTIILSSHFSEIAQIIDKYVSKFLFGEDINFEEAKNFIVVNNVSIFNFIVEEVRKSILLKVSESKICYASYIIRTSYVMTFWSRFNVNDGLF
jgi:hypothetical protein